MLRTRFLLMVAALSLITLIAMAGETEPETELVVAPEAVEALQTPMEDPACKADLSTETTPLSGINGPLDPGDECTDCAGGCQYTCSTHSDCAQQCPNGIGSCNQFGACLCAC